MNEEVQKIIANIERVIKHVLHFDVHRPILHRRNCIETIVQHVERPIYGKSEEK